MKEKYFDGVFHFGIMQGVLNLFQLIHFYSVEMSHKEIEELYPKQEKFLSVRSKMDPDGVFLNEMMVTMIGLYSYCHGYIVISIKIIIHSMYIPGE